jgi:protein-disulfide isomerase
VSQSPYSVFIIPIPIWSAIGYTLFLWLLPFAWQQKGRDGRVWSSFILIALAYTGVSITLASVSAYMIGSYCVLCILIYFVNFFLLWYAWLIRRRFSSSRFIRNFLDDLRFFRQQKRIFLPGLGLFSVAVILVIVMLPPYWRLASEPLSREVAYGLTAEGYPWFGAENPEIEIEMYSDYQCFQCKKMHVYLRKLISGQRQKIRVIHRHYPMDHEVNYIVKEPFHIGSGKMALIAIYAAAKGKFWEMNDLLFEIGGRKKQIDLNWVAEKTGLEAADLVRALNAPVIRNKLSRDVWQGMKLRILGTPSFVINGNLYAGNIPADVLQKYLK